MTDDQLERCYIRRVVLWCLALAFAMAVPFCAKDARAEPFARATADNGSVTLHSDPCELATVSNLPHKAVWVQDGKEFKGCWAHHPYGLIVAFFDDLTVVLIHPQHFQPMRQM